MKEIIMGSEQYSDYLKLQDNNQKLYLSYSLTKEIEKQNSLLEAMRTAEMDFIEDNIPPVAINGDIHGQSIQLSTKPKPEKVTPSVPELLSVQFEKITPENFFDKVSAEDSTGTHVGTDKLKKLLGNNPEAIQKICDLLNLDMSLKLKQQFGNGKELELFETDTDIGFKQKPPIESAPDKEVANIVNRAQQWASSCLQEPSIDKIANDLALSENTLKP
jgi:hypothetical protein